MWAHGKRATVRTNGGWAGGVKVAVVCGFVVNVSEVIRNNEFSNSIQTNMNVRKGMFICSRFFVYCESCHCLFRSGPFLFCSFLTYCDQVNV